MTRKDDIMTTEGFNLQVVTQYFKQLNLITLVDLIIVIILIWGLLNFLGKTRGMQIARGLIFLYVFKLVGTFFKLTLSSEFFENLYRLLFYSLPVIFQREIRIALENFGRIKLLKRTPTETLESIREINKAVNSFSKRKVGALIIIEKTTPLDEFTNTATLLEAKISEDILDCIFTNQSVLHDGAVLIRDNRIISAKCILPLSDIKDANSHFGTRHRAAIGITEVSDCIAIVVSEETGNVSISHLGNITKLHNSNELEQRLIELLNLSQRKRIVLLNS